MGHKNTRQSNTRSSYSHSSCSCVQVTRLLVPRSLVRLIVLGGLCPPSTPCPFRPRNRLSFNPVLLLVHRFALHFEVAQGFTRSGYESSGTGGFGGQSPPHQAKLGLLCRSGLLSFEEIVNWCSFHTINCKIR